jgi:crotonobetainyl-CoA:carnitine CoA-transferase CaiB-like acyl-CoA transferase
VSEGPLQGVVVLDLSRILAGPYATQKLGDMGATVWKVERPGRGDDTRAWGPPFDRQVATYFLAVNRSKRSLALDLKHNQADAVLERLVAAADVVIENFRPGKLAALGWSWERIQQVNPRAVYCTISGYGHEGTRRDEACYDLIAQGEWGAQALTGPPDGAPHKFGLSIADLTAGQHAVEGILLALLQRERTGRGDRVDVAIGDGLLALLTYQAQMALSGVGSPRRFGNTHHSLVPYQTFASADGWLNVGVGNDSLWEVFCRAIERDDLLAQPRFATNPGRVEHRDELVPQLAETLGAHTTAYWLDRLGQAGVPVGPILEVPQALQAASGDTRGMVTTVEHPIGGPLPMVGNPVKLGSLGPDPAYSGPPRVGQHGREILVEAGFASDEVEALIAAGVVGA